VGASPICSAALQDEPRNAYFDAQLLGTSGFQDLQAKGQSLTDYLSKNAAAKAKQATPAPRPSDASRAAGSDRAAEQPYDNPGPAAIPGHIRTVAVPEEELHSNVLN